MARLRVEIADFFRERTSYLVNIYGMQPRAAETFLKLIYLRPRTGPELTIKSPEFMEFAEAFARWSYIRCPAYA